MKNCKENSKQKIKKCTQIDVQAALMIDFQQLYCNGGTFKNYLEQKYPWEAYALGRFVIFVK